MGTSIRPELSEKNQYWIERHRYYELKHFCLQYPFWKKACLALEGLSRRPAELAIFSNTHNDPTAKCAEARLFYMNRMEMIEQSAIAADADLYSYILKGVTEGRSFDNLKLMFDMPCGKDIYYDRYRRFFWILDKERQ